MNPKVSVVIPVYNTALLLSRCLDSVVRQTLKDIEIICVDDGSTDSSGELLDGWAIRDSRIKVIHQSNGRQGKARNAAMGVARGEYIGMVDSDDYIPLDYFERLYDVARRNEADIAVCGIVKQKSVGSRTVIAFDHEEIFTRSEDKFSALHCPPDFHPVNKLYRREMVERIGLRFREGVQYEDVMFVTRALAESTIMVTVPDLAYCYVLNPLSTVKSRQTRAKQQQKYEAHRDMIKYLDEHDIPVAKRHRNITVWHYSVWGICLWKVKEFNKKRTIRLFDALPIWSYKL